MIHPIRQTAVFECLMRRRSVREYSNASLERDTVEALLEAAVHAPTAMGREPWGFVVIQQVERLRRYSDAAKRLLLSQPGGIIGESLHERECRLLSDPDFDIFYGGPTLVVVCRAGPPRAFAEADCWLAAENLMLAAAAAGLGTCCIGLALPLLQQSAIKAELGIPAEGAAVAAIVVGWPASSYLEKPSCRHAPKVNRPGFRGGRLV